MSNSEGLFERAKAVMPGGVNSPVRAFGAVGITPPFIERGQGGHIWDVDGKEYIDYMLSWGPLILGHAPREVVQAIKEQAELGASFGACTKLEVLMAEKINEALPSMEVIRMVNSGTEATMSALRLARGYTGKNIVIKFEGCYHGHSDSLLIKAGSGAITHGTPDSEGIPVGVAKNTIVSKYNNIPMIERIFDEHAGEIAAVIVEPIAGNMGTIEPEKGFLESLRNLTKKNNALLIFDEVITGFRVGFSGAQGLYGITPDITTLGKIIGGGLPVGAYGGREDIMRKVSPEGPVYQAGTLSGNPLAMAAGLATLDYLSENLYIYDELDLKASGLCEGLGKAFASRDIPVTINRIGSMMTLFFNPSKVRDYSSAIKSDAGLYRRYFKAMLSRGIYLPPAQYESFFVSTAHTVMDIESTIAAASEAVKEL